MKRRPLPDLRNARAGIEPKRVPRTDNATQPLGLRVVNLAADPATTELWIYDEIGLYWGISSQDIADALATVETPNVRVRINSPGGDVFEGIAIMNLLASWNGVVTGVVDALCASIATVIAMACEQITMSPGSQMMIHPASGVCFGDEADMTQMAALLGFQTNNIAGLYAARAGGDQADWLALMSAETWMTADEAVTAGLADAAGVVKQSGVAAVPAAAPDLDEMWDLSVYKFAGRAKAPAPAASAPFISGCSCGPKGWPVADRDGQHADYCLRRISLKHAGNPELTPRPTNLPSPAGVQWEVVPFDGCCDICQDVVDASPYPEDDLPDVPVHPNCFPAGTAVSAVDVRATTTRQYDGQMVTFRTGLGNELTLTPNHPVLTPAGWKGAGDLAVGDHVFSSLNGERHAPVDDHDDNAPALIEEVAEAFLRSRGVTAVHVPVAAEDFHGDGVGSEVARVAAYGLLRSGGQSTLCEHHRELVLDGAATNVARLSGPSTGLALFKGMLAAPDGIVGGGSLSAPLLGGHEAGSQSTSFRRPATLDARLNETAADGSTVDAETLGEAILALASDVTLDEIVEIESGPFHGLIYNLETGAGWYMANQIVTHNCDCELQVAYGVDNALADPFTAHFLTSATSPVADDAAELVRQSMREAFV